MEYAYTGARLKELRTRAGLSQESLGRSLGTRPQQISAWETMVQTPNIRWIGKICRELLVEPTALFQPVGS